MHTYAVRDVGSEVRNRMHMKASHARLRTTLAVAAAAAVAISLSGCSSSGSSVHVQTAVTSAPPTGQSTSVLERWDAAYAYLSEQTRPTQIVCVWLRNAGETPTPVPRPVTFYDFSERAAWNGHLVTRDEMALRTGTYEDCEATVPTTVPYGPEIETFLSQYGLTFGDASGDARGLTPIEITYAGQNTSDPDIIYRDTPGLFGLRQALTPVGTTAFEPGTTKIVQPTDAATASRYLRYAAPLLRWYGYNG